MWPWVSRPSSIQRHILVYVAIWISSLLMVVFNTMEVRKLFDQFQQLHDSWRFYWEPWPDTTSNLRSVVYVDIDDKLWQEWGAWPWSSQNLDQLLHQIDDFEPAVMVLLPPLLFDPSGLDLKSKMVHGYQVLPSSSLRLGYLPSPTFVWLDNSFQSINGFIGFDRSEYKTKNHAGFTYLSTDRDAVLRRASLLLSDGPNIYSSVMVAAIEQFLQPKHHQLHQKEWMKQPISYHFPINQLNIETNINGFISIPNMVRWSPESIQASDVLSNQINSRHLKHRIIFIGSNILEPSYLLPNGQTYNSGQIQAAVTEALLHQSIITQPTWGVWVAWLLAAISSFSVAVIYPRTNLTLMALVGLISVVILICVDRLFWFHQRDISSTHALLSLLFFTVLHAIYRLEIIFQNRKDLKSLVNQYVPREHVHLILRHQEKKHIFKSDTRTMTVMFVDIRDFTHKIENMNVEKVTSMLNQFFTELTNRVFYHGGTVDKYVGDMMVAFWGAPRRDNLHAKHAIQAALSIRQACQQMKKKFLEQGFPSLDVGIGINTGMMTVGDMGSARRRNYTVIGDAVNVAARLETISKFYKVTTVVSEKTREKQHDFLFRQLDYVIVKGRHEPIKIYEPMMILNQADKIEQQNIKIYDQALQYYYHQIWDKSLSYFNQLLEKDPNCFLYQIYINRIQYMKKKPPNQQWNGVFDLSDTFF